MFSQLTPENVTSPSTILLRLSASSGSFLSKGFPAPPRSPPRTPAASKLILCHTSCLSFSREGSVCTSAQSHYGFEHATLMLSPLRPSLKPRIGCGDLRDQRRPRSLVERFRGDRGARHPSPVVPGRMLRFWGGGGGVKSRSQ